MPIGRFLGGVAALIRDPNNGKYLLMRRSARQDVGAGSWDCVSGRLEQGEGFEQALRREVREESGLEVDIDFVIATTHFFRGPRIVENELLGVIYACSLRGSPQVQASDEHSEQTWLSPAEADSFLPSGHWLKTVIERAELIRSGLPLGLAEFYRQAGFELR